MRATTLTVLGALVVPDGLVSLGASGQEVTSSSGRQSLGVNALGSAVDGVIVPDFAELSASVIEGALAGSSLVVTRSGAAKEWEVSKLLGQDTLDIREGVGGRVGGANAGISQPAPGGHLTEVVDDRLEELEKIGILGSLRTLFWG